MIADRLIPTKNRRTSASYRLIFGYISLFVAFMGFIMLLPLLMLAFYWDEWACFPIFVIPGVICLVLGISLALFLIPRNKTEKLGKHQDSVLLACIWLISVLVGSLPFFLADKFVPNQDAVSMSFSEAFFESMSGLSATGLTVYKNTLDGVEAYGLTSLYCPHVFLFYRALLQFVGGVGLVLVVASVLSDAYGMKLFYTEGHNDRILPNLARTARTTFLLYAGIIAAGTLGLWLCGLSVFEALCYSIAAMATGGFATRSSGFYYNYEGNGVFAYNQIGAEIVVCVIMLAGATSFLLIYNLVRFRFKNFFKDCEVRFSAFILLIAIVLGAVGIVNQFEGTGTDWGNGFRLSAFQIISCLTTTGFSNAKNLPSLGSSVIWISIILMLIGGGMGSTAGAIKQYRVVVALKELWWSMKYRLSPIRLIHPRLICRAGQVSEVTQEEYRSNTLYIVLYLLVIAVLTGALSWLPGFTVTSSLYEIASSLSGTGNTVVGALDYKAANPTWAYNVYLWVCDVAMILGRLEILPFYFAAVRIGKDILRKETI